MVRTNKVLGCFSMAKRVKPNVVAPAMDDGISTIDREYYRTTIDMTTSTSTLVGNNSSTSALDVAVSI